MPGLYVLHSRSDIESLQRRLPRDGFLCDHDRFAIHSYFSSTQLHVGAAIYPDYPISVLEDENSLTIIEGVIYWDEEQEISRELPVLNQALLRSELRDIPKIVKWLREHDGCYLIFALDKNSGNWAVVNDLLGRLPVYIWQQGDELVLSREIALFTHSSLGFSPDRMGIAQSLIFGFPWGRRTLLGNVERIGAATLVSWNVSRGGLEFTTLERLCFNDSQDANTHRSLEETVDDLVNLFVDGCDRRISLRSGSALSLSGGQDSRSVAAGLARTGKPFKTFTFRDHAGKANKDVLRGSEVAQALHLDWSLIELPPPSGGDMLNLLKSKCGLISLSQADDVHFMKAVADSCGSSTAYFSGDGGDIVLPCLRPKRSFDSIAELRARIVNRYRIFPIPQVSTLLGLSEEEIIDELEALLVAYPEDSLADRYIHYMVYERAMKRSFEGEDRNRAFFWTATPFYSLPFFLKVMKLSAALKRHHRLYAKFLSRLSAAAASVPDAARGLPITSKRFQSRLMLADMMSRFPRLSNHLRKRMRRAGPYTSESMYIQCLNNQVKSSRTLSETMHLRAVRDMVDHPANYSAEAIDTLFTVTCLLESFDGKTTCLESCADTPFV